MMKHKAKHLRILILLSIAGIAWAQLDRKIFYFPDHTGYTTPAADGFPYEEVQLQSKDGTKLSGWFTSRVRTEN